MPHRQLQRRFRLGSYSVQRANAPGRKMSTVLRVALNVGHEVKRIEAILFDGLSPWLSGWNEIATDVERLVKRHVRQHERVHPLLIIRRRGGIKCDEAAASFLQYGVVEKRRGGSAEL